MLEKCEISTDVLVIGSGAAGAMAAIKAKMEGSEVLVVTKGPYPSGNSSIALQSLSVALGNADPRDNPQVHFEDVVRNGKGLSNHKLVRAWVDKIVEIMNEMDGWGVGLVRDNGKLEQRQSAGHTYPRGVHHYYTTGKAIMQCLGKKSRELGVSVLDHSIIGGLFKDNGAITGAWGIQCQTGQLLLIKAKAIVMATGGMGHLFPLSDNVRMITGEGYGMALKAGAELIQMEFCHFLPTPCYPEKIRTGYVFIGTYFELIKNGARLYNVKGERFMKNRYPLVGEKQKDSELINRAIGWEICEAQCGPHGGVFLDVSDIPEEMKKTTFAPIWDTAAKAGVDLNYQPIELGLNPHDLIGGIKINENGSTCVSGLFAAGEAAGGSHGAGRLGGSAMSEAVAFGAISGTNAALHSRKTVARALDFRQLAEIESNLDDVLSRKKGVSPAELKKSIHSVAYNHLNATRNEKGLTLALEKLLQLEKEGFPKTSVNIDGKKQQILQLQEAIEVEGQLELAKAIATAALCRKESRGGSFGGHYRTDYPLQDDKNWLKNIVLKREKDGTIISQTEAPVTES